MRPKAEDEDFCTSQMAIDVDTVKSEVVEDKPPHAFQGQTLDDTDTKIAGEEPTIKQYCCLLCLFQHKTWPLTCTIMESKLLHNHSKTIIDNGDTNCYFHSTVYLLIGSKDQYLGFI